MKHKAQFKFAGIGILVGAIIMAVLAFDRDDKEAPLDVKEGGRLQYKWYATALPKSMSFAGEKVPLHNWEVKERLDRELLMNYYMHGSTLYMLKLTVRSFPVIEKKLKENGLPEDFKYLCAAESALRNQISSAGAVGYWQFLKATGIQYGLEITDEVDERYDLERSTDAACRYLKEAYTRFGSWTAAAAAYNCGMGGFNGQSSFQMTGNYYDLLLPEETNRYVFRILALKLLLSNPEQYGYILQPGDAYPQVKTRTVPVTESIPNLAQFAIDQGSNYKIIKTLNPWLRDRKLTVKPGKTYYISIPES